MGRTLGSELSLIEELWFGDGTDQASEDKAANSMVAMSAKVLGLHPMPHIAQKIIALCRDPNCKVNDLAKLIESDPSFASRTLRLVNSAAFAMRARCTSISHAVTLLGNRNIGELATAWVMLDMFRGEEDTVIQLKIHALSVAALARDLAHRLGFPAEDVYTCGLMHDMGKLFLLQDGEDNYASLLNPNIHSADAVHLTERSTYGYDHAVLAAHVLKAWEIPQPIPTVVAWHHQIARAFSNGGEVARMVCIVRIADQLVYAFQKDGDKEEILASIAKDAAASYINLTQERLSSWWYDLCAIAYESRQLILNTDDTETNGSAVTECYICQQQSPQEPCKQCGRPFCSRHGSIEKQLCVGCSEKHATTSQTDAPPERLEKGHTSSKRLFVPLAAVLLFVILGIVLIVLRG